MNWEAENYSDIDSDESNEQDSDEDSDESSEEYLDEVLMNKLCLWPDIAQHTPTPPKLLDSDESNVEDSDEVLMNKLWPGIAQYSVRGSRFRKRRKTIIEGGNCFLWSELQPALLELIFNRLGAIEFLTCACVCKSWREVALAFKQYFMASQLPLVFLMSRNARKNCYMYNMFDERLYRTELPHLTGNKCLGFTCGYLVLRDSEKKKEKDHIWLVNPFTRHELEFPRPPKPYYRVILASLGAAQQYVVVAYSKTCPFLQFCRFGDADWTFYDHDHDNVGWTILDVAVFKGKIYVLTSHGRLGILSLNSKNPMVTLLPVKNIVQIVVPTYAHDSVYVDLVASHQDLYVSNIHSNEEGLNKIQRLDFEKMVWEDANMNGEILFTSKMKSSGFISFATPSPFSLEESSAGEPLSRVCYLGEANIIGGPAAHYVAGKMNKKMSAIRPDRKPGIPLRSLLWYFPHLSCTVDSVCED